MSIEEEDCEEEEIENEEEDCEAMSEEEDCEEMSVPEWHRLFRTCTIQWTGSATTAARGNGQPTDSGVGRHGNPEGSV